MIILVPAATPVTNPVLSTVAADVLADTQALEDAGAPEPFNCIVAPAHTPAEPVMVGTLLTVNTLSTVFPLLSVKIMWVIPGDKPVTKPVLLTVATDGTVDTHGLDAAGVPEALNCVVLPLQIVSIPAITGVVLTVTVSVVGQPPLFV